MIFSLRRKRAYLMSPSQKSIWNLTFNLKVTWTQHYICQIYIFLRGLSIKEIPLPYHPSLFNMLSFPPPCLVQKKLFWQKIHKSLTYLSGMFAQRIRDFFDWLHKLIFHLHYRATIYSTIKLANPASPVLSTPWLGAKIPGLSSSHHPASCSHTGHRDLTAASLWVHFAYPVPCVWKTLSTSPWTTVCGSCQHYWQSQEHTWPSVQARDAWGIYKRKERTMRDVWDD